MKTHTGTYYQPTSYVTRAPLARRHKPKPWFATTEPLWHHIQTLSSLPVGWWLLWK